MFLYFIHEIYQTCQVRALVYFANFFCDRCPVHFSSFFFCDKCSRSEHILAFERVHLSFELKCLDLVQDFKHVSQGVESEGKVTLQERQNLPSDFSYARVACKLTTSTCKFSRQFSRVTFEMLYKCPKSVCPFVFFFLRRT